MASLLRLSRFTISSSKNKGAVWLPEGRGGNTWTWFLYNKKTLLGPQLGLRVEAKLVFGGSHPLLRPPQGAPELGGEWVFH